MTEVVVMAKPAHPYQQEIKVGAHTLVSDVPRELGGSETGPNPHDLLLGALGACTSITLQMFAKRRGWELQEVTVKLNEDKVEDPDHPGQQIPKITRAIEIKGNLSDEQIEALKVTADKCLVHKMMVGPKQIVSDVRRSD